MVYVIIVYCRRDGIWTTTSYASFENQILNIHHMAFKSRKSHALIKFHWIYIVYSSDFILVRLYSLSELNIHKILSMYTIYTVYTLYIHIKLHCCLNWKLFTIFTNLTWHSDPLYYERWTAHIVNSDLFTYQTSISLSAPVFSAKKHTRLVFLRSRIDKLLQTCFLCIRDVEQIKTWKVLDSNR